jgi:hypothetical protein
MAMPMTTALLASAGFFDVELGAVRGLENLAAPLDQALRHVGDADREF